MRKEIVRLGTIGNHSLQWRDRCRGIVSLFGIYLVFSISAVPADAMPCSGLYAELSAQLSARQDLPTAGTALAVIVRPDGKTQFFYRSEQEANAAAIGMGFAGAPHIQKVPKSEILGQDRMTIAWTGPSDWSKPYDVEKQTHTLNLTENLWAQDFKNRQRSEAFDNPPTMGKVIDELNKVVDRATFDGLNDWVYAVDVSADLPPRVRELVGQSGFGNCFGTTLCAAGVGTNRRIWGDEFQQELAKHFAPATGPLQKGDIGVLYDNHGPIHAFTIIQPGSPANPHDGWVLTKNGQGANRPIHYQRQRESMAAYQEAKSIRYFRRIQSRPPQ